jgi:hypothetical protein
MPTTSASSTTTGTTTCPSWCRRASNAPDHDEIHAAGLYESGSIAIGLFAEASAYDPFAPGTLEPPYLLVDIGGPDDGVLYSPAAVRDVANALLDAADRLAAAQAEALRTAPELFEEQESA